MRVKKSTTRSTVQHAAGEEAHVTHAGDGATLIGQPYWVTVSLTHTGERLTLWSDELDVVRSPMW